MVVCQHTLREGRHDQGSMLVLLQAGGLMEAAQLNCCAHIMLRGDANLQDHVVSMSESKHNRT
jgi:hypothetical protein